MADKVRKLKGYITKNPQQLLGILFVALAIYPLEIAPLGHTSAQVPHSVHKSASIV